jgi:hypothetical protein
MLTISKYVKGGSPTACRSCSQPFPIVGNHISVWHGQDGGYYCQPECEQSSLEPAQHSLVLA